MKKFLLTITAIFVTLLTMAQSPNLMNYQGVARNAVGNVIPNQLIGLRLSILTGTATGSVVYSETRNVFTNAFGLFNVVLGSPGTLAQTGTIAGVNWSGLPSGAANKYLQVEIDPQGGSNFTNVGATQMVSVPYALNAGGAAPIGPAGGDLTGTYPNPQLLIPLIKTQSVTATPMISMTNTATTGTTSAFGLFGSVASTDANANAVQGVVASTSPGAGSAGVRGTNNSTSANGAGVAGTQAGSGIGVLGQSASGSGVRGESGGAGAGVYGLSASGAGVYGNSTTGNGGFFENTNNANTSSTVLATTNSNGNATAVNGINSGTSGRGGLFQVTNAANTASALEAQTAGSGASWGVRSTSTGTNGAGLFVQSNAANTANNVQSNQAGLGTAGFFQTTNTANTADVILASTNTTSTTPAAVHGTAGTSGTSVVAKKGVWGDSDNGWGVYGTSSSSVGVGGTTTTGTGMSAFSFANGTALAAQSLTGIGASVLLPAGNSSTALTATTAGTGVTGNFDNSNAANVSNTLQAINVNSAAGASNPSTGGGEAIFARKGAALTSWLTNPSAVYATSGDPLGIGVASLTNVNIATFGGTVGTGAGVYGATFGNGGTALVGNGTSSATSYGLVTGGKVQIQGQGAGAGKILSSDAVGNATWNTFAALGGVTGTGTLNWVPKWTPNGTNLGNSQIFDDGTNVGVGTGSPNGKLDVANSSNTVRGMQVINSSTTNPSSTIFAQNNSIGGADPVESAAVTGLFSPIAVATPIIAGPSAIKGIASPNATVGFLGGMGVQGASGNGVGVAGISQNGTGVYATGLGGTSYALQTNGRVQIQGQGAGAGKLLSSDATGNATWNTAASLNIVSGNGTLNYMTKWSPDGNTIANSLMFDDGNSVGLGTTTPDHRFTVSHGGSTGIGVNSTSGFSVVDINAQNGDAALRFMAAGVGQWNIRNRPADNYLEIFELGGGGSRMVIQDGTGFVGIGAAATVSPAYQLDVTHGGATGIRSKSTGTFSVVDIDAANGDAALRFQAAGVGQWNTRNNPATNDYQIFELGGGGERLQIQDATGNVGIGNISPAYRLDVQHGGATGAHIVSTSSFSVVDIDAASGDAALRFQRAGVNKWNTRNEPANDDYQWFELGGGGERMRIQRGSGNVGINQPAPAYKLDILHGGATGVHVASSSTFSVVDIDASNGDAALRFQKAGTNMWNTRNRPADDYYEWFELGGGGSRMVIQRGTGNVGIGQTTNPTYKLDVLHGGATGLRVQSSSTFSVVDIDGQNGDAALRFIRAGVNQWNIRNDPANDNLQFFELGGGGERMRIDNTTGKVWVDGDFTALGAKLFTMDHPLDPENKTLAHAAIESNEVMNLYSGNVTTDASGKVTVTLPDYFEAINKDFRYQLTVVGGTFAQAIISKEISNNTFEIATNQPNVKVSWEVKGVRNDARMKMNPFTAVQDKPAAQKGKYLDPKSHNQPLTKGVSYDAGLSSSVNDAKITPASPAKTQSVIGTSVEDKAPVKVAAKVAEKATGTSIEDKAPAKVSTKVADKSGSVMDVAPQKAVVKPVDNSGSIATPVQTEKTKGKE